MVNSNAKPEKMYKMEPSYVNGDRDQDLDYALNDADKLENELTVIRRGKKKYFVLTY